MQGFKIQPKDFIFLISGVEKKKPNFISRKFSLQGECSVRRSINFKGIKQQQVLIKGL